MTRILLASLVLALPLSAAPADDEIRQAERAWAAAVTAGDRGALERLLGDRLIYAHSTGIVDSRADYLTKLRSGAQTYKGIEHQQMTVQVYGDAALVHATVRMTGASNGEPFDNRLMMMHLWVRERGAWKLAAHQTTRLP